ncbi:hypothetical protein DQE84_16160, partial [Staphylococcus warneri]
VDLQVAQPVDGAGNGLPASAESVVLKQSLLVQDQLAGILRAECDHGMDLVRCRTSVRLIISFTGVTEFTQGPE